MAININNTLSCVCRAVGYLPTMRLEHIRNKASRHCAVVNLFHACMQHMVKPLINAGKESCEWASGDGIVR